MIAEGARVGGMTLIKRKPKYCDKPCPSARVEKMFHTSDGLQISV